MLTTKNLPENKFKNSNGVWFLKELFIEFALNKSNAVYSLKDQEHLGYPSLYQLYMQSNDPHEYAFAMEHLGGWAHWKLLQESPFFKPYLDRWREEIELKFRSEALAKIVAASKEGKDTFAASKYLADKGWAPKTVNTKGRPTKADIAAKAHEIAEQEKRAEDDYNRLVN